MGGPSLDDRVAHCRKFVLLLTGGGMRSVFAAGVATALAEAGLCSTECLIAVHGVSAGTIVGAYFLSGYTEVGESLYFDHLQNGFVQMWMPLAFLLRSAAGRNSSPHAVDIGYLIRTMERINPPDFIDRIRQSRVPLIGHVLNLDSRQIDQHPIAEVGDPYAVFHASVAMPPGYAYIPVVCGAPCVDAGIADSMGLRLVLQQYPAAAVVVVENCAERGYSLARELRNQCYGLAALLLSDKRLARFYHGKERQLAADFAVARETERVMLFTPPPEFPVHFFSTDAGRLREGYEMGKEAGQYLARGTVTHAAER